MQVPARFINELQSSIQDVVDATSTASYEALGAENVATHGTWLLEDCVANIAPTILASVFSEVHYEFVAEHTESGTTATVVFLVGHELICANVGDSLAYIDTGAQV
jgi:Protein phosphatase 2C